MKTVAKLSNNGVDWYLRGTTWTSLERADRFDDPILAMSAVLKAKKFTQPKLFKKIEYVGVAK